MNEASSSNIEELAIKKAEDIYKKLSIFNKIKVTDKEIPPLKNDKLQKKERKKEKELTAGKQWGSMKKVELTEEVKRDLKTLKLRNFIYPNKFYKSNDSSKLPQYFQIGTIVSDKSDFKVEKLTKKQAKGGLSDQFFKDD
eukprot:CAMPEP_0170558290 /NCGR_PEP_ID=MMETSP0211-20121228/34226_1 /TAXON_ID=311385 /ORGANISM="Pseudokeronopsis sp., Strain OXSARD2" /LENGTH=139 /DNA_ID=CAMNT_0010870099 /DNA_START=40 /DNA_END=459 /DNA_ORIENTATION=+